MDFTGDVQLVTQLKTIHMLLINFSMHRIRRANYTVAPKEINLILVLSYKQYGAPSKLLFQEADLVIVFISKIVVEERKIWITEEKNSPCFEMEKPFRFISYRG